MKLDLRHGNGIDGLRQVRDAALILTDLPSGKTRAACDDPVNLTEFWGSARESLKGGGTVVVMASDLAFAAEVIQANRKWFRHEIVWHKGRASGFLNAKHRPLRAHEYILVFSPKLGTYNPQKTNGHEPIHHAVQQSAGDNFGAIKPGTPSQAGSTERYPISVLKTACVATNAAIRIHPHQKPLVLLRWLVRTFSNRQDLVIDPCAGSGAVGAAAVLEGRRFIGFEKRREYVQKASTHWDRQDLGLAQ